MPIRYDNHIEGRDIPPKIIDAAALVGAWTERENIHYWRMGDCASRALLEDYERVLLGLGITHMIAGPGGPYDASINVFSTAEGCPMVGTIEIKAGLDRWVCPLVRHDGAPVLVQFVVVGEDGARRMMRKTTPCFPIGVAK